MNKFKFKFNTLTWVLLSVVLALSLAGLIWNVISIVSYYSYGLIKQLPYILTAVLVTFILALDFSMLIYSNYLIKDGFLYCYFGFIKSKIDIKNITEITRFKKTDKLVIYFDKNKYSVIVISPRFYDEFIDSIRKINGKIIYDTRIEGEE